MVLKQVYSSIFSLDRKDIHSTNHKIMKVSPLLVGFSIPIARESSNYLLGKTPFKQRRLQQIETNLSHACYSHITMCTDYTFIPPVGRPTF